MDQEGRAALEHRAAPPGARGHAGELEADGARETRMRRDGGRHGLRGAARRPRALVAVGRIVRTQGRRGEVRVEPLTDAPERLARAAGVLARPAGRGGAARRSRPSGSRGASPS